jgi:hypothetical protein
MKIIVFGAIVFLLILAAGYYIFDQLGGNNPIQITIVNTPPPALSGKTFQGIPRDKNLAETFREMEELVSLNPGTRIHTIYYREPAGKLDTLIVFVGLDLPFPKENLENKNFQEQQFLLATIHANKWVMPSPNKVKTELEEFAFSNNLQLTGIFIDKIISDSEVQVIAPFK